MCPQTIFTQISPFVIFLFSIIIHECSHGWVAGYLGDDTAKLSGRLTLNPIPHLDLFWSILFPVMLALAGLPPFGRAKPVPINPLRFKDYRRGILLTSLAGPLSNLVIAVSLIAIIKIGIITDPQITYVFTSGVIINLVLMIFNLIPIPPTDGSKVLSYFIPGLDNPRFEATGFMILMALVLLGGFSYIIFPLVNLFLNFFGINSFC